MESGWVLLALLGHADGAWVAGGDAGVSWTVTASSQYNNCGAYDLCDYQYAVDGTSAGNGTTGKTFDLNGPLNVLYPQFVHIDFGAPLTVSRWRVWSGANDNYNGRDMSLEGVNGSLIAHAADGAESEPFAPLTVSNINIVILGAWPSSSSTRGTASARSSTRRLPRCRSQ